MWRRTGPIPLRKALKLQEKYPPNGDTFVRDKDIGYLYTGFRQEGKNMGFGRCVYEENDLYESQYDETGMSFGFRRAHDTSFSEMQMKVQGENLKYEIKIGNWRI